MSIGSIMSSSLTALQANQNALRATSTNVANVNTEGYVRLDPNFTPRSSRFGVEGVEVAIQRAADQYLAAAEMRAAASASSQKVVSDFLDRAQGLLGDPSNGSTVFASFDNVLNAFGTLANDPSSNLRRNDVISSLNSFTDQIETTTAEIQSMRDDADLRLKASVDEVNTLLEGIEGLNKSIQQAQIGGSDANQAISERAVLIDRLSELVDIRVQEQDQGRVGLRTTGGYPLLDNEAATLKLEANGEGQNYGRIVATRPNTSAETALDTQLGGGELQGLLQVRDVELVELASAFGEYAAGAFDAINAAHNDSSAYPASTSLTGVNTGLLGTDAHGFTGVVNIAIVDSDGTLQTSLEVDFTNNQISTRDATGATTFDRVAGTTIDDVVNNLNASLGTNVFDFSNGILSAATGTTDGIVIRQDTASADGPSDRAGRGFSHFFGLNNVIDRSEPTNFATGITTTSSATTAHGFTAGDEIVFDVRSSSGVLLHQAQVTVAATAGTLSDFVTNINTQLTGFGEVQFDDDGRLEFSSFSGSTAHSLGVSRDETSRGGTGLSASQIFGLGDLIEARRGAGVSVRSEIKSDVSRLATARPDLEGVGTGTIAVVAAGDGRGATLAESAGDNVMRFGKAGFMGFQTTSLNDYGSRLAGATANRAQTAQRTFDASEALRAEVDARRQSQEGVNIDEELVKMTQYQQAYAAASRMMQAAQQLYDTLLNIV